MKNYERYPNQKHPQTKQEYFDFWKDCPYVQNETISEVTRYQWCILMFGRWYVGECQRSPYIEIPKNIIKKFLN